MCVCVYIYIYIYIYVCVCVCVCVCIYIHLCMYVYGDFTAGLWGLSVNIERLLKISRLGPHIHISG